MKSFEGGPKPKTLESSIQPEMPAVLVEFLAVFSITPADFSEPTKLSHHFVKTLWNSLQNSVSRDAVLTKLVTDKGSFPLTINVPIDLKTKVLDTLDQRALKYGVNIAYSDNVLTSRIIGATINTLFDKDAAAIIPKLGRLTGIFDAQKQALATQTTNTASPTTPIAKTPPLKPTPLQALADRTDGLSNTITTGQKTSPSAKTTSQSRVEGTVAGTNRTTPVTQNHLQVTATRIPSSVLTSSQPRVEIAPNQIAGAPKSLGPTVKTFNI